MKFHLSSEQELIQDSIAGTLAEICPPEQRRAIAESADGFDAATWKALMELGVGGLLLPEDAGGSGLGLLDAALAMEKIGRHAAPASLLGHLLCGLALMRGDDAGAARQWLPELAGGSAIGAFAAGAGWLPETWTATVGDGRLDGEVAWVAGGGDAAVFVVGTAGGGLALVERAAEGVSVTPRPVSDLTRRSASVRFARSPCRVIAAPGSALAAQVVDAGLILLAADALGGAGQCLDMAVEYAKVREQFGVVIGQFQALKHQLADMALEVEPARALVWYAAYAFDQGLAEAPRVAAHAKAHLADRYVNVTRAAVQAHGGIGYTWEYDLHLWFRRALFCRAYLGSPALHRERAAVLAGW